jgi:cytochrome c-type biogenesis protein CcmH/NrfG
MGQAEPAMKAFAEAAKLQPESVQAWLNLATAATAVGSYGRAMVALERARRLAPQDAMVWLRQGEALMDLHRATQKPEYLNRAVDAWYQSLKLDPDQPELFEKVRVLVATTQPALRAGK